MGDDRRFRFYRIEDLIGTDQIDQYVQRSRVSCSALDVDGKYVSSSGVSPAICETGNTEPDQAALERCRHNWMSGAVSSPTAFLHSCPNKTSRHLAALRVGDEVVGYVAGPHFRMSDTPSGISVSDRVEEMNLPPVASPEEIATYGDEVFKIATQLSRRCSSERDLRILNQGVRELSSSSSSIDAQETILDILSALFPSSTVGLYIFEEDGGRLHLFGQRGPRNTELKSQIDVGEGIVGLAFQNRAIQPARQQTRPVAIAAPLLGSTTRALGTVALYAERTGGIGTTGIQTVEVLANCAGMALERSRLVGASTLEVQFTRPSAHSNWIDIAVELMLRRIETGHEASQTRRALFQSLVDLARETSGATRGSVRAKISGQLAVINTSGQGWTDETRRITHREKDGSASWHAAATRQPYLIEDVLAERDHKYYKAVFPDARSNYALPVFLRGEVAAILTLQSTEPKLFTPEVRHILRSMVMQCGDVLERLTDIQDRWLSRLQADLEQTAVDLQTTRPDTSLRGIITALCRTAVTHARKILGAHACSIFLVNQDSGRLVVEASTSPWYGDPSTYDIGEGLTGWVAKFQTTLRLENIKNPEELNRVSPDLKWRQKEWGEIDHTTVEGSFGFLAAPLVCRDRLLGVIRCSLKERPEEVFDFADEILINNVAALVARRIEEIQSRLESAQRIDSLASLVQLDSRLAATQDLRAVGKVILDHVRDITGCVAAHLRFLAADKVTLRLAAEYAPHSEHIPTTLLVGDPKSITGTQAKEKVPLFETRVLDNHKWRDIIKSVMVDANISAAWVTSGACLVLLHDGNLIGTLLLEWATEQDFSPSKRALLEALANRCASAVHAALLYQAQLLEIRDKGLEFFTNPLLPEADDSQFTRGTEERILILDVVLQRFLAESLKLSEIDFGLVRLLDRSRNKWVLRASLSRHTDEPDPKLLSPDLDAVSDDFLGQALRKKDSFLIRTSEKPFREFRARLVGSQAKFVDQLKWLLILPLWGREGCIGFLSLTSSSESEPAPLRILFLETLASFASSAIVSAQLLEIERVNMPLALLGAMLASFRHDAKFLVDDVLRKMNLITDPKQTEVEIRRQGREAGAVMLEIAKRIKQLADFSHGRASSHVDINDVVRKLMAEPMDARFTVGFVVSPTLMPDLPLVKINLEHVDQALRLLMRNAFEAMPGGGDITVSTNQKDSGVVIQITDKGVGMNEETLKHCKELSFTTKPQPDGRRGLGLPVVDLLVRHNGGRLDIESAEGKGTTVSIYFPREGGTNVQSAGGGR
jgi:GAF domain-containing protein